LADRANDACPAVHHVTAIRVDVAPPRSEPGLIGCAAPEALQAGGETHVKRVKGWRGEGGDLDVSSL